MTAQIFALQRTQTWALRRRERYTSARRGSRRFVGRLHHHRMATFTRLQGQYLAFIDAYTKVNGRPPAEADLQRYFEVTPPVVHQMILTLHRLGMITRSPGAARSVRINVAREDVPRLE